TKYGPRVTFVADTQELDDAAPPPDPEPVVVLPLLPLLDPPAHPVRILVSAAIPPLAKTTPPTRITSLRVTAFMLPPSSHVGSQRNCILRRRLGFDSAQRLRP